MWKPLMFRRLFAIKKFRKMQITCSSITKTYFRKTEHKHQKSDWTHPQAWANSLSERPKRRKLQTPTRLRLPKNTTNRKRNLPENRRKAAMQQELRCIIRTNWFHLSLHLENATQASTAFNSFNSFSSKQLAQNMSRPKPRTRLTFCYRPGVIAIRDPNRCS